MSILSTLGDIGKNLVGSAGSVASSLLGGIGNIVGAKMSTDSAERLNAQNIKFQQEQNEIERARADSTLQRTVADAHKAGLSAFDAQSVPLGATSAPQNDVASVSSAMQSLGSADLRTVEAKSDPALDQADPKLCIAEETEATSF